MRFPERCVLMVRHHRFLRRATWLWNLARPTYNRIVGSMAPHGLERNINGTDCLRVLPGLRHVTESYEPEVWAVVMRAIRPGDVVADIGACIGLYTVALARRVGPTGCVFAFEPDPANFALLKAQVKLNGVEDRVELIPEAVADRDATLLFVAGRQSESRLLLRRGEVGEPVQGRCLDSAFADRRLDLLKIDVEGFEEAVLRGARQLLLDPDRAPRTLFIEVHPYAWPPIGVTDRSLLQVLSDAGYAVTDLDGRAVTRIGCWGEIVAHRTVEATHQ